MKYMLDTNICSYIIKQKPLSVLEKLKTVPIEECGISSITLAELRYWVGKNKRLHQKSRNTGKPNINEEKTLEKIQKEEQQVPVVVFISRPPYI